MGELKITVYLLAYVTWTVALGDDCVYKECTCTQKIISCEGVELQKIPEKHGPGPDLGLLYLSTTSITDIPAGSLPSNLKELTIDDTPISRIDDSSFNESSDTLDTLSLTNVMLTRIPDAIHRLNALKSLTIMDTNIVDWNTEAMLHVGDTVETLYIENCGVVAWPKWLQNFTQLKELSLSRGLVSSVPIGAFDKIKDKLTKLELVHNSLTSVPRAVAEMSALTILNLQQNQISDLTWLPEHCNLTTLALNNNSISDADHLSKALLSYATTLYELDINFNRLTAIPNISFLTTVKNLDFSYNRISDPSSGSLPPAMYTITFQSNYLPLIPRVMMNVREVTGLTVFSNLIKEIRGVDFPPWIQIAEISHNLITDLTDTSFPENCSLQYLFLHYNPLSTISSQAFRNTQELSQINLQNTKLTRIPLALASVNTLRNVDFTGSAGLVCTCEEMALRKWVMSLSPESILGDCGEMSVYNFFAILGPDCPE